MPHHVAQHTPNNTGGFIGQGDARPVGAAPFHKFRQPIVTGPCRERCSAQFHRTYHCASAMDQKRSNIAVAPLGDTQQTGFYTGGVLSGHQSKICSKFAAFLEVASSSCDGQKDSGRKNAYCWVLFGTKRIRGR